MKKHLLIVPAVIWLCAAAHAQAPCGTMEYNRKLIEDNPQYQAVWDMLSERGPQFISGYRGGAPVITIPVVVHVVWKTTGQNISDAQILSQLDVLNEDFRRLNADTANTYSWAKPFAADPKFEFCLAVRDPNNDSTTGITRTQTTRSVFTVLGNEVKKPAMGGVAPWPTSDYLNIWVCNLETPVLGYAQFPGMDPSTDGIVVHYQAMGRFPANPFGTQYKGRSCTHEVGHWFNLRHIWGDDPGCGIDDEVDDTPLQTNEHFVCGSYNTCTDVPVDYNDMVQNYMDYSPDACMNLFTTGQTARMHDALNTYRSSLFNSLGCYSVYNPPMVDFSADATTACIGDTITFTDESINFPTSWQWSFPGGVPGSDTVEQPKVVYSSAGSYQVKLVATNVYGTDSLTKTVYITITGANDAVTLNESFESSTFAPGQWTISNPNADRTWTRNTTVSGFGASSACMKFDNFTSPLTTGKLDWFISDRLDFSGLVDPFVSLDVAYAKRSPLLSDTLKVMYSIDCGQSFLPLWSKGGSDLATAPDQSSAFTPTAAQWRKDTFSLAALAGFPTVNIALVNRSGSGNNIYIDNINISSTPQAAPVAEFTSDEVEGCPGASVKFFDESLNQPDTWSWSFSGGTPSCTTCQDPVVTFANAGTYDAMLTVTNALGTDSITKTAFITIHAAPSVTISKTDVVCFGQSTGSATANVTGGTPPYTYAWTGGGVQPTKNNLSAGTHTVTVTDSQGCKTIKSVTINQNQQIIVNTASTPNTGGGNGTATASGVGGVPPLSYLWNDPAAQTTSTATGLWGGSYKCTITDNVGCSKVVTVVVGGPPNGIDEPGTYALTVHPNPTNGWIQVELPFAADGQLEVFDVLGRVIRHEYISSKKALLDLGGVPRGNYIIIFRSDDFTATGTVAVMR